MHIAFTKRPDIDFELEVANISVMNIPGVDSLVKSVIGGVMDGMMVWPNKMT
jgi:Ca2+-dependent lipid-binding protein